MCLQNYGTADLGNVAYETVPDAPMVVDEGVIVEIVTPVQVIPFKKEKLEKLLLHL